MRAKSRLVAVLAIAWGAGGAAGAFAQSPQTAMPTGRAYPAVNGTTIRCPLPVARPAEQQAAQFETRPRDLDALSVMAKQMMTGDNPAAIAFRKRQDEQRASDWAFLCRYRDANAALVESGRRPEAVLMGDSITEGWIEARPDFFERHHYVDRGISGQSSSQMLARFYQDVVALRPRAVHIMAGTNDIGGATGPITMDEFIGNMTAMIAIAQAHGIKVILAGIPPMSRLLPRPEFNLRPVVRAMNARLEALAHQRGVVWVDYYAPLVDAAGAFDPRFANDGVHPTRAGYAIMEPLAEKAIAHALGD